MFSSSVFVCACVCVCVRERERERERDLVASTLLCLSPISFVFLCYHCVLFFECELLEHIFCSSCCCICSLRLFFNIYSSHSLLELKTSSLPLAGITCCQFLKLLQWYCSSFIIIAASCHSSRGRELRLCRYRALSSSIVIKKRHACLLQRMIVCWTRRK